MKSFKNVYLTFVIMASALLVLGLGTVYAGSTPVVKSLDGTHKLCKNLVAGQNITIGTVCIEVINDSVVVTYAISTSAAADGWRIKSTSFWTGTHVEDMPQNKKGNPVIGKFPYKSLSPLSSLVTSYIQLIPLLNLSFACPADKDVDFYAAAHADVVKIDSGGAIVQTETAWGDGQRLVTQGNWGMYFTYTLSCSNNELQRRCETSFAVEQGWAYSPSPSPGDSMCFLDITSTGNFTPRTLGPGNKLVSNGNFDRWGWTTGPLAEGVYMLDIFAAAGRCILSNGFDVGTLYVTYANGMVDVTYDISPEAYTNGWGIDQLHLYVGTEPLPRDVNDEYTVAPGQYIIIKDHVEDFLNDTSTLGPFSGDIYVVAHATVCRYE